METVTTIHDAAFVAALIAIVMTPRVIETYRAFRRQSPER
jgi:hypothetical protein